MLKWDFSDLKKFGINLRYVMLDTVTLDDPSGSLPTQTILRFCVFLEVYLMNKPFHTKLPVVLVEESCVLEVIFYYPYYF